MSNYMPATAQDPQPGGVTLDTSLPPRFVWHITWDKLDANGRQPQFSAVANYLKNVGYCPHIMWNPFTGEMVQYYPANVGARALAYNNQDGAACIQVEVFFTPGCVVDGIKYDTVADTPLKGWADLLAWADSLGVPRVWPMGAPQWQNNARDVTIWNGRAGHYGHCNSPGDTHTDPGPMPALTGITTQGIITPVQEDDLMATPEERAALIQELLLTPVTQPEGGTSTLSEMIAETRSHHLQIIGNRPVIDAGQAEDIVQAVTARVPAAVLNAQFTLPDGTITNLAGILAAIHAQPAGTITPAPLADPSAVAAAVLADLRAQLAK